MGLFLRVLVLTFVAQGAVAATKNCQPLLQRKALFEKVSVKKQAALVARYETLAKQIDKKAVVSDLNVVSRILQVYNSLRDETIENMQEFTLKKRHLEDATNEYLAYRYGTLNEKEAESVTAILKTVTWNPTKILGRDSEKDLTAVFMPNIPRIHFEMPEHYKNTLIHWFSMMHEMEHAIQHERLKNSFKDHSHTVSPYAMNEIKYLSELGAMTSEWIFLQGVNKAEIEKEKARIEAAHDIERSYREFFLRVLSNYHLPLEEYLALEHAAGRYSRAAIVYEPKLEALAK